jgi:hypothetical protein
MWLRLAQENEIKSLTSAQLEKLALSATELVPEAQNVTKSYLVHVERYVNNKLKPQTPEIQKEQAELIKIIREEFEVFQEFMRNYSRPSLDFYKSQGIHHEEFDQWHEGVDKDELKMKYLLKHMSDILRELGVTRRDFRGMNDEEILMSLLDSEHANKINNWLEENYYEDDHHVEFAEKLHKIEVYEKWLESNFQVDEHKELIQKITKTFERLLYNENYMQYDESGMPHCVIVMGLPGAGKSYYLENIKNYVSDGGLLNPGNATHALIDPDYFAQFIPGFADGRGSNNVLVWTKSIQTNLLKSFPGEGKPLPNVVIPLVGTIPRQVKTEIDRFRSLGYNVELVYVHSNDENIGSFSRSLSDGSRVVPPTPETIDEHSIAKVFMDFVNSEHGIQFTAVNGNKAKLNDDTFITMELPDYIKNDQRVKVEQI